MPEIKICAADASWGPFVHGCRDDFDFTIRFERAIFSILVSAVAILLLVLGLRSLRKQPRLISPGWPRGGAILGFSVLLVLHIIMLGFSSTSSFDQKSTIIVSDAMAALVVPVMAAVSFLNHSRSLRPPLVLQSYLLLSLGLDAVQVRTMWLVSHTAQTSTYAGLYTAAVSVKAGALLMESLAQREPLGHGSQYSAEQKAGIFELASFAWLNSLLLAGYKKSVELPDLYPLIPYLRTMRGTFDFRASVGTGIRSRLAARLAKEFCPGLFFTAIFRALVAGFSFAQVFLLRAVLLHLQSSKDDASVRAGYGLIAATFLIYTGKCMANALYWYFHEAILCKSRTMLVEALWNRIIAGSTVTSSDTKAVTLMGTEVDRVRAGFRSLHDLWCCPIEAAVASWLLYEQLGSAMSAPLVLLLLIIVITALLGRVVPRFQRRWIQMRHERIALAASTLKDIESLHISNLTDAAESALQSKRNVEVEVGQRYRVLQLLIIVLAYCPARLSPVLVFAFTTSALGTTRIFQSMALLMLLTEPLSQLFQCLPAFLSALACLKQIEQFLSTPAQVHHRTFQAADQLSKPDGSIVITACSLAQAESQRSSGPRSDINIPRGALTVISGASGSGKSTLCKAIFRGLLPHQGGEEVCGSSPEAIGYCDQEPHLINGTIRQNILGHALYDTKLYDEVIEAVRLNHDFARLDRGDLSEVGNSGAKLSGGQKRRVALARALYACPSVYVLDDVFAGLDSRTAEHIFSHVLGPEGFAKRRGATAILATGSSQYLQVADCVVSFGPDGMCEIRNNSRAESGLGGVSVMFENSHAIPAVTDQLSEKATEAESSSDDTASTVSSKSPVKSTVVCSSTSESCADNVPNKENSSLTMYKYYLKACGVAPLLLFFGLATLYAFCYNFSTAWLSFWTLDRFHQERGFYLSILGLLAGLTLLLLFAAMATCLLCMIKSSSRQVHRDILQALMRAPVWFVTGTDHGAITSLFSQDLNIVDGELPSAVMNTIMSTLMSLGVVGVLAATSPYLLLGIPVLVAVLWVVARLYLRTARRLRILDLEAREPLYAHFLDTIRGIATVNAFQWKGYCTEIHGNLLDTSQRASYLLAMIMRWLEFVLGMTITGLGTLLIALAVTLRSDAAISGASFIALLSLGNVLIAIVEFGSKMQVAMGTVARLRDFASQVDAGKVAVSALEAVPYDWPSAGKIVVKQIDVSYQRSLSQSSEAHFALRNVSIVVKPGSKVAVVGRTGSGKSTLLRILLRLIDPSPTSRGRVEIDGIPLDTIDPDMIRKRIIAVPQTGVLLPGASFKDNIDPYNDSTRAECSEVLRATGLASLVHREGGLDSTVCGDSLSNGEVQLLGLARAVLRKQQQRLSSRTFPAPSQQVDERSCGRADGDAARGILLLDEIGSAVDATAYKAMWNIIQQEFCDFTVVAVVHRLDEEALKAFDSVVVMKDGEVVESGGVSESDYVRALLADRSSRA